MASSPFIASAAIIRPSASKAKPRTRPPVFANTSCDPPSGSMRNRLPLVIAAYSLPSGPIAMCSGPNSFPMSIVRSPARRVFGTWAPT